MENAAFKKLALAIKPLAQHDAEDRLANLRDTVAADLRRVAVKEDDPGFWERNVYVGDFNYLTLDWQRQAVTALVEAQAKLVFVLKTCTIEEECSSESVSAWQHEEKRLEELKRLAEQVTIAEESLARFIKTLAVDRETHRNKPFSREDCKRIFALFHVLAETVAEL
jgi:hypothetical protein